MAISDAYATAAQYRAVTGQTDETKDDDILTDLKAISRYLDGKLGRFFTKDAADVARIYIPPASQTAIWINDLSAAPTSVELDEDDDNTYSTALTTDDYELLPLNADKGPEPRPYTRIGMTAWGGYSAFTKGIRVKITGKFGWPSVPDSIQRATIHLTAILRLETPRATRRIAELGDVMEASPDAMSIIRQLTDRYRKIRYI